MSRPEIRKESYYNKFTNQRNGHHSFYLPRSTRLKVPRHFSSLGASEGTRQSLQVCLLGSEQRQLMNAVDTGAKGLTTAPLVKCSPSEDSGAHTETHCPASLYIPSCPQDRVTQRSTPARDTLARGSLETNYLNWLPKSLPLNVSQGQILQEILFLILTSFPRLSCTQILYTGQGPSLQSSFLE